MGFFLGFFVGIGAGVAFGENGLNFPLLYQPKENGFGKLEVNLEVLDPVYKQFLSVSNYFNSVRGKTVKSSDHVEIIEPVLSIDPAVNVQNPVASVQ